MFTLSFSLSLKYDFVFCSFYFKFRRRLKSMPTPMYKVWRRKHNTGQITFLPLMFVMLLSDLLTHTSRKKSFLSTKYKRASHFDEWAAESERARGLSILFSIKCKGERERRKTRNKLKGRRWVSECTMPGLGQIWKANKQPCEQQAESIPSRRTLECLWGGVLPRESEHFGLVCS